jgi:Ca2+-binding RTX toxin-like protein
MAGQQADTLYGGAGNDVIMSDQPPLTINSIARHAYPTGGKGLKHLKNNRKTASRVFKRRVMRGKSVTSTYRVCVTCYEKYSDDFYNHQISKQSISTTTARFTGIEYPRLPVCAENIR